MRSRWWNRLLLLIIAGLTALSFITVWPSEPDRYLPNAIPWPEGKGIKLYLPTIEGGSFRLAEVNRREMSLGLDLRGGTRLVLAPEDGVVLPPDLGDALEGAQEVIERRVNAFGVAESEVNRLGNDRIQVQLPGIDPEEAVDKIGRTALLQFCEPVLEEATGNVAIVRDGAVRYRPQTCDPARDEDGNIIVEDGAVEFAPWAPTGSPQVETNPSPDLIVWQPAKGDLDGVETELSGRFLRDTSVQPGGQLGLDVDLAFEWTGDGAEISEQVTEKLAERNYPLAPFLDGEPIQGDDGTIIAPSVQSTITGSGVINGLSRNEAEELSTLLNTGAFPIPLQVLQQQDVDATLGDTAVRNSVIAGQVALILIMVFMIAYYRLPGLIASLALVCYTSFSLAVFKLGLPGTGPIVLTLGGVAAFVLSVGMAVDANILIFERMKEELRLGRNLAVALDDGFHRAWSSIRDSNISTFITCVILYWFGNQFGESAIKGFAVVLAIGVAISMFSAIVVTRVFMRELIGFRFVARRPWLLVADLPEEVRHSHRAPAIAGGAGGGPARERER